MPATSLSAPSGLNSPYGGTLIDLRVDEARAAEMRTTAKDYASLSLDEWGLCDLELLATGTFSPLDGFLNRADYERVVAEMRLADGTLWPLPIALPVTPGAGVAEGQPLALRDVYGNLLAFLHVEEIYAYDKAAEAQGAYGSTDAKHPSVAYLQRQPGHYAAGRLEVMRTPPITTSSSCGGRRPSCGRTSRTWVGPGSSRSRPATRCTAPTRN